jgi:predicted N-acyltransferase
LADDACEQVELTLSVVDGLQRVDRDAWNAVANPPDASYDPFLDWDFLEALESSGCATPRSGWDARHVLAHDAAGRLVGAAPVYVKSHSRGEFVFDHSWADALERAGGRYYPKLLCAVPFTPVIGRRLLAIGPQAPGIRQALTDTIVGMAADAKLSSAHFNFLDPQTSQELHTYGLLPRQDQQFHWRNNGYETFEDFLGALASRKRKMIRRERREAQDCLTFLRLSGDDLKPEHWDAFFKFYMDTGGRKWGSPYLNRKFFALLHERMADRVMLVLAMDGPRPIAGALNLIGGDALYGRYWGRAVERPFLHFEVCYYQAMDFAIDHRIPRVEAGAQGEHKLARGYEPSLTRSAHWIAHPGLRHAVAQYLDRERAAVQEGIDYLAAFAPFRKNGGDGGSADRTAEQDEESF